MAETPIARLKRILREKAAAAEGPLSVPLRRKTMEEIAFKVAPDIGVETVTVAGRDAEWLRAPGVRAGRTILYLHGGGYVIGSPNTHRSLAGEVS
jgi:acetyl esterase/lipase